MSETVTMQEQGASIWDAFSAGIMSKPGALIAALDEAETVIVAALTDARLAGCVAQTRPAKPACAGFVPRAMTR
jgi:hypothetical protein